MSGSLAATDTATFQVRIEIQAGCNISSANDLDFGSISTLISNVDGSTTIGIQCTNTTPYDVGLDAGLGVGATITDRIMTGPGGAVIAYSLYQDAGRSNPWGDIGSPDAVAGTGSGAIQTLNVYGRVPPQSLPAPGNYSDTITVTLTF